MIEKLRTPRFAALAFTATLLLGPTNACSDTPHESTKAVSTSSVPNTVTTKPPVKHPKLEDFGVTEHEIKEIVGAETSKSFVEKVPVLSALGQCIVARIINAPSSQVPSFVIIQNPVMVKTNLTDQQTGKKVSTKIWAAVLPTPKDIEGNLNHHIYPDIAVNDILEFGLWGTVPESKPTDKLSPVVLERKDDIARPKSEIGNLYNDEGGLVSLMPVDGLIPGQSYWLLNSQFEEIDKYCEVQGNVKQRLGIDATESQYLPEF